MSLTYTLVMEVRHGEKSNLFQRRDRSGQRTPKQRENRGRNATGSLRTPDGGRPHGSREGFLIFWESAPGLFSGTEKVFAIKIGPPARPGVDVGIVS